MKETIVYCYSLIESNTQESQSIKYVGFLFGLFGHADSLYEWDPEVGPGVNNNKISKLIDKRSTKLNEKDQCVLLITEHEINTHENQSIKYIDFLFGLFGHAVSLYEWVLEIGPGVNKNKSAHSLTKNQQNSMKETNVFC